jgi:pyruvate formate lyase activating enzyme
MENEFNLKPIFAGIQSFSTIDDNNHLSLILFTGGCNFRCHYCYNKDFVFKEKIKFLPIEKIKTLLKKRQNLTESVVICGGEPTLHENLLQWCKYIKSLGFRVKLDTNGTNPKILKELIENKLIDFISIDYKAPIDKYKQITQKKLNTLRFFFSIKFIVNSGIDYEFRTTIHSEFLTFKDIKQMILELKEFGVKNYFLQNFLENTKTITDIKTSNKFKSQNKELLNELKYNFEKFGIRNN